MTSSYLKGQSGGELGNLLFVMGATTYDEVSSKVSVGDVFRSTYGDHPGYPDMDRNGRTVRIIEVTPKGVKADVLTECSGNPVSKPRVTRIGFKTLSTLYTCIAKSSGDT